MGFKEDWKSSWKSNTLVMVVAVVAGMVVENFLNVL